MKNLYAALLKAQAEFQPVPKDGRNPAFKSTYATLGSVQETAFPVLNKHGLLVIQSARTDWLAGGSPVVTVGATLVHAESGESISQELGLMPAKVDPQGIGSAISYGRRYILLTMLGLSADDDDGQAASQRPAAQVAPPRSAAPPPPVDEEFQPNGDDAPITETLLKTLHATGTELYGNLWDDKRHELVRSVTKGRTTSSKAITMGEAMRLLDGMGEKLRNAAAAQPALVDTPPKKSKRQEFA